MVKLEVKRGMGEPFIVVLHKGRAAWPFGRLITFQHTLPVYVRSLVDAYKVEYRYWELFECFRKVTLVGAFIAHFDAATWKTTKRSPFRKRRAICTICS